MYVKLLRYMYVRKNMIGHLNKPSINKINICANFFQSPMREYLVYHHSPLLVFSLIDANFIVVWDTWVTRFTLFVNLWQRSCKIMGKQICTLNKVKVPYRILWELTLRHYRPIVCSELGGNTKWLKKAEVLYLISDSFVNWV